MVSIFTGREYALKIIKEEEQIQRAVVYWLRKTYPSAMFTISPITKLTISQGARMKAMGYTKGSPDLMVFEPRGPWHGLFIEFKSAKGRLTPDQLHWKNKLDSKNYYHAVCRTPEDAIEILKKYL